MRLFGKRNDPQRAIAEFWSWWPGIRPRVEAAISSGGWNDLIGQISARVDAIDSGLQWEFMKGTSAKHALVVCPGGAARLRATAARWLAAAPPADSTWEYHAARQAEPAALEGKLEIAGQALDISQMRFGFTVDADRAEIDVVGHHPAFASLPENAHAQITFLALDWSLGEDAVELWIGRVDNSATSPENAQPAQTLVTAVASLAERHRKPIWTLLQGRSPSGGGPVVAVAQRPLKAVRWPRFDTHVAVVLPYRTANDAGLPVDGSLDALRAFEDSLTEAVGDDAVLVAHESANGVRTLHFYADPATESVGTIRQAVPEWSEGGASVDVTYDPSLQAVRHLS
jgi:hypothetical protein